MDSQKRASRFRDQRHLYATYGKFRKRNHEFELNVKNNNDNIVVVSMGQQACLFILSHANKNGRSNRKNFLPNKEDLYLNLHKTFKRLVNDYLIFIVT